MTARSSTQTTAQHDVVLHDNACQSNGRVYKGHEQSALAVHLHGTASEHRLRLSTGRTSSSNNNNNNNNNSRLLSAICLETRIKRCVVTNLADSLHDGGHVLQVATGSVAKGPSRRPTDCQCPHDRRGATQCVHGLNGCVYLAYHLGSAVSVLIFMSEPVS